VSASDTVPAGQRVALPPTAISVLFGGPSAEHDVSLVSGRSIATALLERGHAVSGWLIDLDARWWQLPLTSLDPGLAGAAFRDPLRLGAGGPFAAPAALEQLAATRPRPVVFPAMHGPFGEDGQVQSLLESVGLTYCGAGPAASAVGMDKTLFKRICGALGLPVLPWLEVRAHDYSADRERVAAELVEFANGLGDRRLICKPARLGSSIGITIVHRPDDRAELGAAIEAALRYDDLVLLEPYLDHPRELETSVLGNSRSDTAAYGPGEVVPGREFYDYIAKYQSDDSLTMAQADLPADLMDDIRAAAVKAYLAIGACGFARVDMLLSSDRIPYISEINTIPGFTPISLFPRMTAQGGYDFADTCERIVQLALEQAADRPPRHLGARDLP
jgi:D-alanine-D-alanine ligase